MNRDQETHRQFRIRRKGDQWIVAIEEYRYGNDGGEAGDRLVSYPGQSLVRKSLSEVSRDGQAEALRMVQELNLGG